jgi:uncharacterized membrane protein
MNTSPIPLANRTLWHLRLNAKQGVGIAFPNTAVNSPLVYAPQIVAIEILRPFNPPPVLMLYLGRLFGMIAATVLIFYAVKLLPFGKWGLVAVGLVPMTVTVLASFAADGMTIGLSILLVAYIVHLAYAKPPLRRQQFVILGLLLAGVGFAKSTYILLAFLVPLIPLINPQLRSRKNYLILAGLVLIGLCCALLWTHETSYIKSIYPDGPTNSVAQIQYLKHHAAYYVAVPLPNTVFTSVSNGIIQSLIGQFASLTIPLPLEYVLITAFTLGFSFIAITPDELKRRLPLPRSARLLTILVAGASIFAICTALYVYWSTVGEDIVVGLQGRYFIPVLFLGIIIFSTRHVVVDAYFRAKLIGGASLLVLIVSFFICMARFYSLHQFI